MNTETKQHATCWYDIFEQEWGIRIYGSNRVIKFKTQEKRDIFLDTHNIEISEGK